MVRAIMERVRLAVFAKTGHALWLLPSHVLTLALTKRVSVRIPTANQIWAIRAKTARNRIARAIWTMDTRHRRRRAHDHRIRPLRDQ